MAIGARAAVVCVSHRLGQIVGQFRGSSRTSLLARSIGRIARETHHDRGQHTGCVFVVGLANHLRPSSDDTPLVRGERVVFHNGAA